MKKNSAVGKLIKMVICLVIIFVFLGISYVADIIDNVKEVFADHADVTAKNILLVVIMAAGVIAIKNLLSLILGIISPKSHRAKTILTIINSVIQYVSAIIILCWGLAILGVNVSTIIASVGIIALIVGFGAESLISDLVTGVFMIFENQYNVGDIVEVGGFRGVVSNISIRTTSITDNSGNIKIINNSDMNNILNRSDNSSKAVSDISIPYETDLEKLEEQLPKLLADMFAAHPDLMKSEPVYLGVQELADSSVVLRFVVEVNEADIFKGIRILNHDLFIGFRKLGVECPFPQLDVHTK